MRYDILKIGNNINNVWLYENWLWCYHIVSKWALSLQTLKFLLKYQTFNFSLSISVDNATCISQFQTNYIGIILEQFM